MIIFLIGYRCCGKTSAGKILAQELGFDFVDADEFLQEKEKKSVTDLVSEKGWEHFRHLESQYLEQLCKNKNLVIATGGGVVEKDENILLLKTKGKTVWLKASFETISSRMNKDNASKSLRPSLTGKKIEDEISDVCKKRYPIYKDACLFSVCTDDLDPQSVVYEILKKL